MYYTESTRRVRRGLTTAAAHNRTDIESCGGFRRAARQKGERFAELSIARRECAGEIENLLVASYIVCSRQNN
jgi:hypothetical protein